MSDYTPFVVGAVVTLVVLVGLHLLDRRIDAARKELFERRQADMVRQALLARTQRPRLVADEVDEGDEGGRPVWPRDAA
jgi:hypothetical protein